MQINLIADNSVSSAPAGFTAAVQAAAAIFDRDIPGNYTVNITYGWGTYDNEPDQELSPQDNSTFSLGGYDEEDTFSYSTVRNLLTTTAVTSAQIVAASSLPATSPFGTDKITLSSAQEKALHQFTGSSSAIDGSIGFNTADVSGGVLSSFTKEAALAEIAHALGFFSGLGTSTSAYVLDLDRYAASGIRYTTSSQPSYLSINGGATNLANYDTDGFDPTLFINLPDDPLSLYASSEGNQATLTALDIEALDVMGFAGTSTLFGNTTHDVTSPAGEVYSLYQAILGRAADTGGLQTYAEQAAGGTSLQTIAQSMLGSAEYANDYGSSTQSNTGFVTQLYLDGLHRQPDAGGLATYDNDLTAGVSRAQVAFDIATSAESQNDLTSTFQSGVFVPSSTDAAVAQLYYGLLDRGPDATGLAYHEIAVAQGESLLNTASDFISSPEFTALHGQQTNAQFVTSLYNGALGRDPDVGGLNAYVTALNGGASRASIALNIVECPEANAHLAPLIKSDYTLA